MTAPSVALWPHLHCLANLACSEFGLVLKELEPVAADKEEKNVYGRCYEDGTVKLRVHMYRRPTRALSRKVIVDTLAHELAHLREWRHGKGHRELTTQILTLWRERGVA